MRPLHDFTPARVVAQHCPELLGPVRDGENKDEWASRFAGTLCDDLPTQLEPLLGKRIKALAGEPETRTAASLLREIGKPSASYAVRLPNSGATLLVAFDLATASSVTERLFGGDGKLARDAYDGLPLSARIAVERVVRALAIASGEPDAPDVAYDSDITRLAPFPRGEYCACWSIEVSQDGYDSWQLRLAVLESALPGLCAGPGTSAKVPAPRPFLEAAADAPFEVVPMPVTAVLAETRLSLTRLASLKPGDLLPIAPRREVQLRIGAHPVAYGSIGTLDERVALQLTRIA